jgi:hypothetical protein
MVKPEESVLESIGIVAVCDPEYVTDFGAADLTDFQCWESFDACRSRIPVGTTRGTLECK